MRTSTKIWLILTIISNVALFYFFAPMIDALKYIDGGIRFEFTWETYVGLGMFIIANIAGTIVMVRFIKSQPLHRQIFFSTLIPTTTFVLLMLFFFTITTRDQTDIVAIVRSTLGINEASSRFIWMAVVVAVYALFMYVTYINLSKPVKKIERVVEVLRDGKTRKPIKVGGGVQFQGIEYDLNQINENYKENEKLIKNLTTEAVEEEIKKKENAEQIQLNIDS